MSSPHDALFKSVLGNPEHARGALRAVVPAAVGEAIDWATLAHCPGSFVDPKLLGSHTDLLFSAVWRSGGEALLYLLFEHQSTSDDRMAFRLLRYLVRIWERWWDEHPDRPLLPVIVPVVLYHDAKPWSPALEFEALLDLPLQTRSAIEPYLVRMTYLLDDLSQISDQQLRERAITALVKLVAVCFRDARTRADLLDRLARWTDVMGEVFAAPNGSEALSRVMYYILSVSSVGEEELQRFVHDNVSEQAGETVMATGQQLIQQGIQQGVQQGIQQGERKLLLHQLRTRFGHEINAAIEQRIAGASGEQVELWAERLLSAATLAELMAE